MIINIMSWMIVVSKIYNYTYWLVVFGKHGLDYGLSISVGNGIFIIPN